MSPIAALYRLPSNGSTSSQRAKDLLPPAWPLRSLTVHLAGRTLDRLDWTRSSYGASRAVA
jgi:hypothetical protein